MVKVHRIKPQKQQAPMVSWVPVIDPDGHTRMEMRWHVGESSKSTAHRTPRSAA